MGKVKGRSHLASAELRRLALDFHNGGLSNNAILEHINTLDMVGEKPVRLKTLKDWLASTVEVQKEQLIQATYHDVLYLRKRAYHATAMTEINRYQYIVERAYWWGLYISALHIMLRQALAIDMAAELPPQFIMDNLEKFYADIRAVQQMTPPLDLGGEEGETVEELNQRMKEFGQKYGKNLKLPKETL